MNNILIIGGKGYIGSRLKDYLSLFKYTITTYDLIDNRNIANIDKNFLQLFDCIIYLAGESVATKCEKYPVTTWNNNVENFINTVNLLTDNQKFIYASSGSVYGQTGSYPQSEDCKLNNPIQQYDLQKQIIDKYMLDNKFVDQWFGLRFGTVCGYSSNPRNRLLVNSMVRSAIRGNKVTVTNAESFRAILGLKDLCRAMYSIITSKENESGIYNLATFNTSFGDLGERVASFLDVEFIYSPGQDKYSFALNTSKFQNNFNFEFVNSLESIINECKKNDFAKDRL